MITRYIPQRVHVAPLPGAKALPITTVVPVGFVANSTSSDDIYAPGVLQVLYQIGVNTGGSSTIQCQGIMMSAIELDWH